MIQDTCYTIEFVVLSSCSHDVILGWDFLSCHNAVIDCARAEVELFAQSDVPPSEGSPSDETKLVISEHIDIPPQSSVLVALSCSAMPDGPVLFTPSDLFVRRKNLPLPFAVRTLQSGRTTMFICNQTNSLVTLLRGE